MTFKSNWEKLSEYTTVPDHDIHALVAHAFPTRTIDRYEILTGGCANLNIKLFFHNDKTPLILRLYFRDRDAAYREQKLAELVKATIPVAQFYEVGDFEQYRYAITEYIEGIPLRDLLLDHPEENIYDVMHAAGAILAAIQAYRFDHPGFFDANLQVNSPFSTQELIHFVQKLLTDTMIIQSVETSQLDTIKHIFETHRPFFPPENSTHLVHADYDPANILVRKIHNTWKIAAVIDWEFAFSGPWLCDVANMVRYAHQMPPIFAQAFLEGIHDAGLVLPDNWRTTVDLLNLISLLDCLAHSNPTQRPHQHADIMQLIQHILHRLKS
jgi:Ser/Thr protein kinase RdoA (MazF antagonist)